MAGAALAACAPTQTAVAPNEVDIGFCQDMAFHHEQALAMCQRVLGRATGSSVQTAAADILQNQSYERGMMHTWLQSWGESTAPPTTVMGWMGMGMPAADMPGLATVEQMRELATAEGLAQGRLFLTLMRSHHVGGVHMADAATGAATAPVRHIAKQASATQAFEIAMFDELLLTTYAT
ncbi:MAG: DUF305 domain-containing protein [Salinibacterium sp.]|nr:DUF305 domain-containing protein [Salinibacterium sp.]